MHGEIRTMRATWLILVVGVAALLAGCGGQSDEQKAAEAFSRPVDCSHLKQTTLRVTECVPRTAVGSISGKTAKTHSAIAKVSCKTRLEATFYAANDWLSLAAALAKHASPCAEYYISIPSVQGREGTWTIPRPGEAKKIRHFGPNFHAMSGVRVWAWANWVKKHKKSWHDAGVLARKRIIGAGYSFTLGDIWAVNEFPLTLPGSTEEKKAMTEFVRGLYEGGPHEQNRQGLVWRVVPFQDATGGELGRPQVRSWLKDDSFWRSMSKYARFWSSEVFAFPSASCTGSLADRAANVTNYLNALVLLAEHGKEEDKVARDYLRRAYSPLENAAWQWTFGFGITTIPAEQMAKFVSLQVYSSAKFAQSRPKLQTPVRLGFAWAPNPQHLAKGTFARGNELILERMSTALHDAITPDGIHPARACGRDGRDCLCKYAGAELNPTWMSFSRWND
jgi:hypothetical protein